MKIEGIALQDAILKEEKSCFILRNAKKDYKVVSKGMQAAKDYLFVRKGQQIVISGKEENNIIYTEKAKIMLSQQINHKGEEDK